MKSISSEEMCWRVVSSLGRKQISVQIILHNSEFLLPAHVVSGRLSGWAGWLFKPNKLAQVGSLTAYSRFLQNEVTSHHP